MRNSDVWASLRRADLGAVCLPLGCERGVLGSRGRSREEREEEIARVEALGCSHQRAVCSITQNNGTR